MKILCRRDSLAQGFKIISSLAVGRTAVGSTHGILLEAREDSLVLSASDGEVTATHVVPEAKVEGPERILVDPVLGNIIQDLSDETVALELEGDGSTVKVQGRGNAYEVPTSDPDEFKGLEAEAGGTSLVLKAEVFKSAVARSAFAVAREATRFAFNGLKVEADAGEDVHFVGSDGRRLSLVTCAADEGPAEKLDALVPKRAFADFIKAMPAEGGTVRLTFSPTRMVMELGCTTVCAQLIEGKYPDYRAVVPKKAANRVEIPCRPLEDALRRIILVSGSDSPVAKLTFYSHGELEIQATQGSKSGKESLDVKLEGPGGEVSFNPAYLIDFLRAAGREVVTLHFQDNQMPGKFEAGEDFVHVVMTISL